MQKSKFKMAIQKPKRIEYDILFWQINQALESLNELNRKNKKINRYIFRTYKP
jgi:hypothetical protein